MNQPSVYRYENIIDAAFELIREQGWSKVTARAIAKKLGSSTMPIYSHVRSVDDLEADLRKKARLLLKSFQQREYTEQILLNLAFGYIVFARDEKQLFRFLYQDKPEKYDLEKISAVKSNFLDEFGQDSEAAQALQELEQSGQDFLVKYTWIFTHGLAMLVNAGATESDSDQDILNMLMDAGEAFYVLGMSREQRKQEQKETQAEQQDEKQASEQVEK